MHRSTQSRGRRFWFTLLGQCELVKPRLKSNLSRLRRLVLLETGPGAKGHEADGDDQDLAGVEDHQPLEGGTHESVRVQSHVEHVDSKPGEGGHDITKHSQVHHAAFADHASPACVEDECVPDDDQQGAVFLGIPSPETSPGLIRPDTPQDCSNETEQR